MSTLSLLCFLLACFAVRAFAQDDVDMPLFSDEPSPSDDPFASDVPSGDPDDPFVTSAPTPGPMPSSSEAPVPDQTEAPEPVCTNNKLDGTTDMGCTSEMPLCRGLGRMELAPGEQGDVCVECGVGQGSALDICFAIDRSFSLSTVELGVEQQFVAGLIDAVEQATDNARYAALYFSDFAQIIFELTSNGTEAMELVSEESFLDGGTDHATAIRTCARTLTDSSRPRLVLLLTDGEHYPFEEVRRPINAASTVRASGVVIGAVGVDISNTTYSDYLRDDVSSRPSLYTNASFENLETFTDLLTNRRTCVG